MAKERIFSDALCLNITPEMRSRLNRFIAERCGHYAKPAPVVRDLINMALAYYGYTSPEAQQPQVPPPFPASPFQAPPINNGGHRANP